MDQFWATCYVLRDQLIKTSGGPICNLTTCDVTQSNALRNRGPFDAATFDVPLLQRPLLQFGPLNTIFRPNTMSNDTKEYQQEDQYQYVSNPDVLQLDQTRNTG